MCCDSLGNPPEEYGEERLRGGRRPSQGIKRHPGSWELRRIPMVMHQRDGGARMGWMRPSLPLGGSGSAMLDASQSVNSTNGWWFRIRLRGGARQAALSSMEGPGSRPRGVL